MKLAHAILLAGGRYALQLRDDKPGIAAPGTWCLFGGSLNDGEEPLSAIRREVAEELALTELEFVAFWATDAFSESLQAIAAYNFFEADCTASWPAHQLREGQAVRLFAYEETQSLPMTDIMRRVLARHHHSR